MREKLYYHILLEATDKKPKHDKLESRYPVHLDRACRLWRSLQQNEEILKQQKKEAKHGRFSGLGCNSKRLASLKVIAFTSWWSGKCISVEEKPNYPV